MEKFFRRYTDLAATIHLLQCKRITLLNPATWDDNNDRHFMAAYKRYRNAKTLLALCFAECKERYHHWKVYSNGPDGVCIEFDKEKLLSTFSGNSETKHRSVKYKKMDGANSRKPIKSDELPFLKRYPYIDEKEYRVVYVSAEKAEYKDFPIEIGWIKRITLSPWMSKTLRGSVVSTLKSIKGCSDLHIYKSTLIDNDTWKRLTSA